VLRETKTKTAPAAARPAMVKTKRAKILSFAKGFYGRRKNCFTVAVRAVHMAWQNAYIGRKIKKRDARLTWIQQINAGARQHGMTYSQLIRGLPLAGLDLNRKALANLAATEPYSFKAVISAAQQACQQRSGQVQPLR
jgi:large subunit ribosomal protein L20